MKAEALAEKVKSSDMRMEEIAVALGMSLQTLYTKIRGESEFKVSEAVELKKALHLTTDQFMEIFFE